MKNRNLQDLFNKVMSEERNDIKSLDEKSSELIKGGAGSNAFDEDCTVKLGCSKIKN
ncbi:hypothetical protein [Siphonobacter sp. SORGH_AS_1065]|uniref:hypothetical protein n=1 Tax=Siphonobacter sp. SORGH_AS_1065 TaxID=3041795 RepID=UPI0027D86791|nr:hypothetical protein [Siphonobacter sp. SORGH_AS_1065]